MDHMPKEGAQLGPRSRPKGLGGHHVQAGRGMGLRAQEKRGFT